MFNNGWLLWCSSFGRKTHCAQKQCISTNHHVQVNILETLACSWIKACLRYPHICVCGGYATVFHVCLQTQSLYENVCTCALIVLLLHSLYFCNELPKNDPPLATGGRVMYCGWIINHVLSYYSLLKILLGLHHTNAVWCVTHEQTSETHFSCAQVILHISGCWEWHHIVYLGVATKHVRWRRQLQRWQIWQQEAYDRCGKWYGGSVSVSWLWI